MIAPNVSMPSLRELGLEGSPRTDPLTYPGRAVKSSCLLTGSWLYLAQARAHRRIGQWHLRVDGGPLTSGILEEQLKECRLNYALLALNAAPMDRRYPILAIGSNASPGQLTHKYSALGINNVVPITQAEVRGIAIGHSAHVSAHGYIPFAPRAKDGASAILYVLWLDEAQRRVLGETEPNYHLRLLDGEAYPLTLGSHERLGFYGIYVSKFGILSPTEKAPDTGERAVFPPDTQRRLIDQLVSRPRFRDILPSQLAQDVIHALRRDRSLRKRVTEEFALQELVTQDGLLAANGGMRQYGELISRSSHGYVVKPTSETIRRQGEQYVVLDVETMRSLATTHAVVSNALDLAAPAALARAVASSELESTRGVLCLDQTIRNGIGVEIGEPVRLRPARARNTPLTDRLLGARKHLLCRTQVASLPTVEQQVCTADPIVLEMLGVVSGDEVVVEGLPHPGELTVPLIRLKAYATPRETVEQRELLTGGHIGARYPSARDALGVYPDLPWIFLDDSTRSALGLGQDKLAVVRLSASRRYQLAKEVREILLLLILAFIGLASFLQSTVAVGAATAALVCLALFVIHRRLRQRLAHKRVDPQGCRLLP